MSVLDRVSAAFRPTGSGLPEVDAPIGDVLDLLGVPRRRAAIKIVAEADEPPTFRDLAKEIAAQEYDKPAATVTNAEYKRVYVGLYQSHFDDLEAAGVIDIVDEDVVYPGPEIDAYLQLLLALEDALGGDD